MHSVSFDTDSGNVDGGDVLVAIAALVTESRTIRQSEKGCHGFYEGPHCYQSRASQGHRCDDNNAVCLKYNNVRSQVLGYWEKLVPVCIEVLVQLNCRNCNKIDDRTPPKLLEQWYLNIEQKRSHSDCTGLVFTLNQLIGAIRSQLHFSQITAWLLKKEFGPDGCAPSKDPPFSVLYRLSVPGETYQPTKFSTAAQSHNFPVVEIEQGTVIEISLLTLPRMQEIPQLTMCSNCQKQSGIVKTVPTSKPLFDDRMHHVCTLKGKHKCEEENFQENPFDSPPSTSNGYSGCRSGFHNKDYRNGHCTNGSTSGSASTTGTATDGCTAGSTNGSVKKDFSNLDRHLPSTSKQQPCTLKGKHRCDYDGSVTPKNSRRKPQLRVDIAKANAAKELDLELSSDEVNEVLCVLQHPLNNHQHINNDLSSNNGCKEGSGGRGGGVAVERNVCKSDILLDAILRSSKRENESNDFDDMMASDMNMIKCKCDTISMNASSDNKFSIKDNIYVDVQCDRVRSKRKCDRSNLIHRVNRKITFDDEHNGSSPNGGESLLSCCTEALCDDDGNNNNTNINVYNVAGIPSALEKAKFRKNLDSAASMVFHSKTGLPLTSSPAPVRRGKSCFDFDSSINSVSAISSALFSLATDDDSESDCSIVSPCSPDYSTSLTQSESLPVKYRKGQAANLLGSFEESVLNGRLEPDSTVHGFTAELGASGSFVPRHLIVPVTVFFYTLGDNSSPYLGHINLGKKGYNVPKSGTVQVTLFNPLRTVVKMFVIMYDLSDMPVNSQTFIRQRTLYMPINCKDFNIEYSQKWLRYLVHLRFMSSKSGRIYLHSDIRMIIFRKSDLDTATAHGLEMSSYELRSFTHMPSNPKYSPRK